jgi:hypothetical protein
VPAIEFVSGKDPDAPVAEGDTVSVTCSSGYTYGGSSARNVVCSSSTNNFPASCRSECINLFYQSEKRVTPSTLVRDRLFQLESFSLSVLESPIRLLRN